MEIDGTQLSDGLRGKQVPLLLAYLVLNRSRHVGRDELIGALWPDNAPVSQDAALRTLLSRLRSALGTSALVGRDELILDLPAPVWVDLEAASVEVSRAQEALEDGDARAAWGLAQVPLNIASRGLLPSAQASWIEPRRRDLEDVRLQALEVVGRAGLSLGGAQLASAERAARTLIDAEPYRESGYGILMDALAAQGNVAEGTRVFDRLRTLLRDELGTTPSAETLAIHERLLMPGGRPAQVEATTPSNGAIEMPPELRVRSTAPLVGRRAELDSLRRLWSRARDTDDNGSDASGRVVLLAGDPGIGKTRLVAELASAAHEAGAYVLAGRSPEETLVPYQPFLEAIRHYVLNVPYAILRASAREYGSELSRLVPELRRRVPELPPPAPGEPETERYRLFEAVVGLLSEIASRAPVLLVLDDLQWADRPTLLLLRHLARARHASRLLILGAYRDTEAAHGGFGAALSELRRERLVTELDIAGLAESETGKLVEIRTGMVPTHEFTRALQAETEGNPFFVEEIVRHMVESGLRTDHADATDLRDAGLPEGVKEVISRRLGRLDEQAIEWLRVAAVIGRDFDVDLLERVVSLSEDEFLNALDAVLAAGLLSESDPPGPLQLLPRTHPRGPVRGDVARRGGPAPTAGLARRSKLRGASATTLRWRSTSRARLAPRTPRRRSGTRSARADQASAMLAHEEAAEHYARALDVLDEDDPETLPRRCELLLLLGEARVRAGERPRAWDTVPPGRGARRAAR